MKILILGGGGFIGSNLAQKLSESGNSVTIADIKKPLYLYTNKISSKYIICDLRNYGAVNAILSNKYDEIYQLAADVGGAKYIGTGMNDSEIMTNSALININVVKACVKHKIKKILFSSSSCAYPVPEGNYGLEKYFSENVYESFRKSIGLNIRVVRFQNVYGMNDYINTCRERFIPAVCRKVIESKNYVEIWGDGSQMRSFVYVEDCISAMIELMQKDFHLPVNIGGVMSEINDIAEKLILISGKSLKIKNIFGQEFFERYGYECPVGIGEKKSSNYLLRKITNYEPKTPLNEGLSITYNWIKKQMNEN